MIEYHNPLNLMINSEEIRIKKLEFDQERDEKKSDFSKMEDLRKDFLRKFPQDKLSNLPIEQYVSGKPDTFCNLLERGLEKLGSIRGARADKFGIYYGKTIGDTLVTYRFPKRFGSNKDEAYEAVKTALNDLLMAGKRKDFNAIDENILSPMFKGKILNTYYPAYYLNVFSREYLKFYLLNLQGTPFSVSDNENNMALGQKLIDLKNNDPIMKYWSNIEYSYFLWGKIGKPITGSEISKWINNGNSELPDNMELPLLSNIKPNEIKPQPVNITDEIISNNTGDVQKNHKKNYVRQARRNTIVGDRGEEIVMRIEKEILNKANRHDLAEKVDRVSADDDWLGYDIHSFTPDGQDKYIEVKATTLPFTIRPFFYISANEYNEGLKKKEQYYICWVFATASEKPDYWYIQNPFGLPPEKITIKPRSYSVSFQLD